MGRGKRGTRGGGKEGQGERWGRGGIWEGSWKLGTEGSSEDSLTWGNPGLVPIPDKRLKKEKSMLQTNMDVMAPFCKNSKCICPK